MVTPFGMTPPPEGQVHMCPANSPPVPASPPPVPEDELNRLLRGEHHDPHSLLGPHLGPDGLYVRALRPTADKVVAVTEDGRFALHPQGFGLFAGLLPYREVPDYRLEVYAGDTSTITDDAYRFRPLLGELDLHLIQEGCHRLIWQVLGAHVRTFPSVLGDILGTSFAVWAPHARGVRVIGDFNNWCGAAHPMRSLGASGVWELFIPGADSGRRYKYEVLGCDGHWREKADPFAAAAECPPATASIIFASDYRWGDEKWMTRELGVAHAEPLSIYELHLGSWMPGKTYRELAELLPAYISDLGFTHVELLPVAEHPYEGSWGYQPTSYFAPTARLGDPDDFRYLVDRLHQAGIGVILDWVPGHFARDHWALAQFDGAPLYEHADPRRAEHPDWGTLTFDFGRPEVRNFLIGSALSWCMDFHIDGLRVDAVASMLYLDYSRGEGEWDPNWFGGREHLEAVSFLQELNATLYECVPGVMMIAEESTSWPGVTDMTDVGGLGFGFKWNLGWMHDSLAYMKRDPVYRTYHHGELTFSMVYAYSENFVLPISHDEVVHGKGSLLSKMPGDRWQRFASLRAYLAYMWAHPGKQLLFMGQELGQETEWSHMEGLPHDLLALPEHAGVHRLVRDLNTIYRDTAALWRHDSSPEGFKWVVDDAADDNILAFLRADDPRMHVLCVSNFSPRVHYNYQLGLPCTGRWVEILNTDSAAYGGSDVGNLGEVHGDTPPCHGFPTGVRIVVPPLATIWLRHLPA